MIVLYHSIVPDSNSAKHWGTARMLTLTHFKHHILWLANHYRIVSLAEYVASRQQPEFNKRRLVAVTFDDGWRMTFQSVFSFLIEKNIPATFFVTTGHLEHGELLWFSYLKALCFEKLYKTIEINRDIFPLQTLFQCRQAWRALAMLAKASGEPVNFSKMLAKTYPLPDGVVAMYEGMTYDQLNAAGKSDQLELGAHTITHPNLNQTSKKKQAQEIFNCKSILSEFTRKPVRYFAYPGGEYNYDTLELVKAAGYEAAFAVIPKQLEVGLQFEIGRVGIYSPSLLKLQMKAMGVAGLARRLGLRVG